MSPALRLLLRALLTITLVWAMTRWIPQYFTLTGGIFAIIAIGALLTLLNLFVRPLLAIITFPLKLFATLLAIIAVNGAFIWITHVATLRMDASLVTMTIGGGITGWVVVASLLGAANFLMKLVLK